MFKPDKPIETTDDDCLGRLAFSDSFGKAILDYRKKDSIVTAIYGDWGSGKSSVINMTLEYIEKKSEDKNKKPIIVKFNPWNYSDQSHLIALFFKELSFALQRKDYSMKINNIGEKLEAYANRFTYLTWMPDPTVAGVALATKKVFSGAGKVAKEWGAANSKDLNATRSELNKLLGEQKRKLIIVIDDIDRLNNDEIRQIFQLVKMVGDFPNTLYVLAFDRGVVVKALEKVQKGFGDGYLEKIVQFSVELPPISEFELEEILFSFLDGFIKEIPEEKWDSENWYFEHWMDVYYGRIENFFKTIRDIIRFINTLEFSFPMVRENVNPVDFIAITALQVFEPDLYSGIKNNKDLFAGRIIDGYQPDDAEKKQTESRLNEIVGRAKSFKEKELIELLSILFPKIKGVHGGEKHDRDWMSTQRIRMRICHPELFDTYFLLATPPGKIPNSEITSVLDLASDKKAFKAVLIRLNEEGKILKYLSAMTDFTKYYILPENIQNITAVLMDIGDTFPRGIARAFGAGTNFQILRIFKQLNLRIDKQEDRFENINRAINESTESIYTIAHKVSFLGGEHGKLTSKTQVELKPDNEREVSAEQLTLLESRAVEKISEWAMKGKLDKHPNLEGILHCWKQCDSNDSDAVKKYVKKILTNDDGLINFITAFVKSSFFRRAISSSFQLEDGYVTRSNSWINPGAIANFVNIEDIEPRIRQLQSSVNYPDLSKNQKNVIAIFLDTYDKSKNGKN